MSKYIQICRWIQKIKDSECVQHDLEKSSQMVSKNRNGEFHVYYIHAERFAKKVYNHVNSILHFSSDIDIYIRKHLTINISLK
jgi:hypothetical protein